ncbi:hypothetical protein FOB46_00525 [Citrobacter braakii]|nr:hypothetical protein [Citrobacter braakii]
MPRELFALLDKSKLGSSEPIICNQFTGACLATSYGTQGVLVRTLNDYALSDSIIFATLLYLAWQTKASIF